MSHPYPSPTSKPFSRGRGRGRGGASFRGGSSSGGNPNYRGGTSRGGTSFRSRGSRGRGGTNRNFNQGDGNNFQSSSSGNYQGNRGGRGRGGKSKFGGDGQQPTKSKLDDIIDAYLEQQYATTESGDTVLDLSNIASNQYLIDNVREFNPARIYRKLCERVVQKHPDVNLLDLRNNNLSSLFSFSPLTGLQNLTGLCLSNNNFSTVADLQHLSGLQSLKQLYLNGNKCYSERPSEQDVITLLQYFPSLDVIDTVLIPDSFKNRGSIIPPINIDNVYLEINRDALEKFVLLFFDSLDDNRPALSTLFDDHGSFSISLDDNMLLEPQYAKLHEKKRNLQPSNPNLNPQYLIKTVFKNKLDRDGAFKSLPKSKHNLDTQYLVVDCNVYHSVSQNQKVPIWMLTIHGHGTHFKPQGSKDSFSFTASFVLKQGTDRLLISNLIYHLRPYAGTSRDAFVDICQQVIYTNQLDLAKQAKLRECVYHTRLKPEVAFELLNLPDVAWTPRKFSEVYELYKQNGTINAAHYL